MSYMIFIAKTTSVYGDSLLFIPWMRIQKLPSIILALVCHLCLPQPLHTCEVLRVRSKWRYLVMIVVPSHAIPNDMLFNVLFAVISLSL